MPDDFQISNGTTKGRTVLLRVAGRLDTKTASQLLHRCRAVRSGGQNLVLNLSEVSFIASSGIGALLALVEQFHESGASVRFAALSSPVESVIPPLSLHLSLTIHSCAPDALSALEK